MSKSIVYFTKDISSESLIKIYEKLGVELNGKIGVKVSTGEAGSKGYLKADLIGPLVKKINGTIIECNTAYPGKRNNASDHLKVASEHGFTSYANVDIMDSDGEFKIPVKNGKHLEYDLVGDKALEMAKVSPKIEYSDKYLKENLISYNDTPCFKMNRYTLKNSPLSLTGGPSVWIVLDGTGVMYSKDYKRALNKGEYFLLPNDLDNKFKIKGNIKLIECIGSDSNVKCFN